ncbi:MAG: maleylacetoacetate isomerase [Brevundimonas sp.]|uniref:maleylacetoacetate isomerase n=1 Tax=Brevundimonas sp. TaxID=1871086 RepID=UPI000DB0137E|nr:maleylacetoacetate isomerase [Brevundimonas sp.]PZT96910.1 MAG: maleylacetoacetate isomerase [Brevundimonas sp.]
MILHGYWRSGASYRVRIALALKGIGYDLAAHDLRTGEQKAADYLALNPQGMVPALQTGDRVLIQSPAILEWLEETHPSPPLLPSGADDRAAVRAMCALIGCDIHPLNNLRVLKALRADFAADQAAVNAWAAAWIATGFDALQALVDRHGTDWCFGDAPTLADCYLIPQLYSARRFDMDLSPWPHLLAVEARAQAHPAFEAAHPDRQPDAD